MKAIKKAQAGTTVKDKTAVVKPKRKPTIVRNEPKYIDPTTKEKVKLKTAKDSSEYKKGYNSGVEQRGNSELYRALSTNKPWNAGNEEGYYDKRTRKKLKSGGSIKAKDGMWMQKVSKSIEKRGTKGKCTPISKKSCTGKAKTLALTFKKIAKSNKKK
jgi:hypothetical protein